MPLNIPVGDGVAAWHFRYDNDPEEMVCTMGVRPATPPLAQGAAERLLAAWRTHLLPQQLSTVQLLRCTVRTRQDGGGDIVHVATPSTTAIGTTTGSGLPSNSAIIVEKLTLRAGRRGRGRMFVPGINDTQVDNAGLVAAANIASWNTALQAFLGALGAVSGGTPVQSPVIPLLLHGSTTETVRSSSPGSRTVTVTEVGEGPLPDEITNFVIDPRIGTQRRRLR